MQVIPDFLALFERFLSVIWTALWVGWWRGNNDRNWLLDLGLGQN